MNIKTILKSTLIAFVIICVFILTTAALVYFNIISQRIATIIVFGGIVTGVFIGAFIAARVCDSKILLNSLFVGILTSAILYIIAIVLNGTPSFSIKTAALFGSILASSVVGAIMANK